MPKISEREAHPQEFEIPEELPIIPLVSTIVFPNIVVNLQVVRKRNLQLVRDLPPEGIVGLVIQRGSGLDFPPVEDLTQIGVAARLVTRINVSRNTIQIILLGLARFKVTQYSATDPYLKARVECIEEPDVESMEANVLMGNALHLLETLVRQDSRVSEEILHLIRNNLTGPGNLADQIANHLNFKLEDKKEILCTLQPLERLQCAIRLLKRALDQIKVGQEIQEATQEEISKSQREYFLREQLKTIRRELGEGNEAEAAITEMRKRLGEGNYPEAVLKEATRELDRLATINPASAEYSVVKTYLDWLLELPWTSVTTDNLDIAKAREILERDHYGLHKIKDRILEYLAVRKLKADMKGPILCFFGPPGVGKTSLGKSIAEALGRKFIRMSVGGMRDEAEIRGHRRTYVGAMPGKIIQNIRRAGTANPLFIIDEIDKIGSDFRGDPASALLEVLDPEQNSGFLDLYLDVPFDLSRVMFLTTANRLDTIPEPLRDRMEILPLSGYTEEEKVAIAKQYLVPRQIDSHGLKTDQLGFDRKILVEMIRGYTSEAGLRRLEQLIGQVCRKIAKSVALGEPARGKIGTEDLTEFLGPAPYLPEIAERRDEVGVATGLAWTAAGGDILLIEASRMKGRGGFNLTGQLGDVMKESAHAALSYVRSHAAELGIFDADFSRTDIHLHVPAGAIPKDGPSAGVTIATALASLLSNRRVRHDLAMTGEISLRGKVLPVGGVKEKVLAARRSGIRTVILPARNEKDLLDIPEEVRKTMTFQFAREIGDVLREALRPSKGSAQGERTEPAGPRTRREPSGKAKSPAAAARTR
ncbi:MAG TPA: endopeptidase La [Candidatus Polarisedimenticolia bacterium]|nr:endopeptidase La [Candidatus Polarisedimenticolia bacterium]